MVITEAQRCQTFWQECGRKLTTDGPIFDPKNLKSSETFNFTGFMGQMWPPLVFLIPAFPSETPGLQAALRYQHPKLLSTPETATSISPVVEITPPLPNPIEFASQSKSLTCLRIAGARATQIRKFKLSFALGTSAPCQSKSSPAWLKNACGDVRGASLMCLLVTPAKSRSIQVECSLKPYAYKVKWQFEITQLDVMDVG